MKLSRELQKIIACGKFKGFVVGVIEILSFYIVGVSK